MKQECHQRSKWAGGKDMMICDNRCPSYSVQGSRNRLYKRGKVFTKAPIFMLPCLPCKNDYFAKTERRHTASRIQLETVGRRYVHPSQMIGRKTRYNDGPRGTRSPTMWAMGGHFRNLKSQFANGTENSSDSKNRWY